MRRNISTASTASHIVICYLYTVIMQCLSPLLTHTRACYTYAIHFMRSSVHNILYYMMIHSILPSILPDGCTQCDGSRCSFGGSPGGGQQRCGQMCRNNPNICNSAADGCRVCYGSTCTSGGAATCGTFCSNNNQCVNALNGCTTCQNGVCDGNRFINPGGNCVSNEQALRSRLQGGGTIDICPNANILVNGEIQTSRSYIDLRCSGGGSGCTIRGGSNMNTRLLYFTGSSITLQGIAFQSGSANGSGGAIKIDGTNNRITNCRFTGNKASQRGGAGSVGSATFVGNTYSGNYAAQCVNFFQSNTGSCFG
jgi:hypothetical protein